MKKAQALQKVEQMIIDRQFLEAKELLVDIMEKDPKNPEVYYYNIGIIMVCGVIQSFLSN